MLTDKESIEPLEKIALTFSGGGYRAAAYSLGILSYFNRVKFKGKPLLNNVKAISTVSGGTITGASYAVACAEGISFTDYYKKMFDFLNEDWLLDKAVKKLENDAHWKSNFKKQSLINAIAETYLELLTDKKFGFLDQNKSHLEDIIFNATEFNTANAFRFQNTGLFGNKMLNCKELNDVKNEIKIADVIAASSCFPMGFEPIVFPNDFLPKDLRGYDKLKIKKEYREGVGLMDGGIVDNQGVGSMIWADKRRNDNVPKEKFDLLMICDVAGPDMGNWMPEPDMELKGWRKKTILQIDTLLSGKGKLLWSSLLLLISGIGIAIIAEIFKWSYIMVWMGGIISGIALILIIIGLLVKTSLRVSR